MTGTNNQRIPMNERTHWMSDRHIRYYGKPIRMVNLDQFGESNYLEYDGDELTHLADYKNELERIELWHWAIKNQAKLATNSNIPFFIVVGYQKENCFWLIPGNQLAKDWKHAEHCNKWITEKQYVWLLYALRNKKVTDFLTTEEIVLLDNKKPTVTLVPNVQGSI